MVERPKWREEKKGVNRYLKLKDCKSNFTKNNLHPRPQRGA